MIQRTNRNASPKRKTLIIVIIIQFVRLGDLARFGIPSPGIFTEALESSPEEAVIAFQPMGSN